ncbi:bifunctional glycosyltransferase/CDP-glycerol:glycerophosphate glycerophosphotransferase [Mangrovihabitans endophyticus]|uniref:Glycosyltransferase 2-like domain-containing protein n=1 Tax=Mangrovihabitans endophyticus TaxID=1751298 RepID=A0A8J3C4W0_9ACTN|nr:CDP-glycerol glycerophosphotransferase family protein [Mangrovihabitans endophyticus]GGL08723.1 hypothetical protein GCM10012284_49200 [Mangrovihabitans endophyticus]
MPELVPGLVSVIVPIYNVEPFLRDCLDSLRSQTYRDLQVVMVDDGCTDGCVPIAEEFAAADDRFTLIRQENAGLSAARNNGLPYATGEYLAFVDSDDILAAHAYETLVAALNAEGADFASGGVHRYSSRGHYSGYPHNAAITSTRLSTHVSQNHRLLRDRTIWNKLFRRSFYDAHGFEFPVGRLFEDVPVTVPAHARATSVAVVNEPMYFWRVREGAVRSITQSDNDLRNMVDRFFSVNLTRDLLTESGHHDLRRIYEEQAIWDKLSSYLKYLPGASPEFRDTFLDLATAYIAAVDPGAVDRQPARVRPQWQAIRDRRVDDLIELIDQDFRPVVKPPAQPRLESAVRRMEWRDGKLVVTGHAYVPGSVPSRFGLRLLWLSADGSGRKVPLRARPHREPTGSPAEQASGFTIELNPSALRGRAGWRGGTWTVAVAATRGIGVRRDGLRVPDDWTAPMPRQRVDAGVWVSPAIVKGRLRIKVTKSAGWLTGSRRDGDDLVLEGRLRARPKAPVRIALNRARGLVVRSVVAEVTDGPHGPAFTARLPLSGIALDDHTDNHAGGLFAQRFGVDISIGDKAVALIADDDYRQIRTVVGADEVYTTVAASGLVALCTRPAGPVVTDAQWQTGGALLLRGDAPEPVDGRLVLRLRGRRRDVTFPLRSADGRWQVLVDPSAAPSLAGPLPLTAGVWDFSFRAAGHHHETTCPIGFTDAVRTALPTSAVAPGGARSVLRPAGGERATITVEVPQRDPAAQERMRAEHFPATGRAPLRDVVLFDGASGRRFVDDQAAVLAELRSRPDAPEALWTVERGQPVPDGAAPVTYETAAWYAALATSRWVVANDDLPRWFTPAQGQVVLRLGGGWPVARFGACAVAHPLGRELIDQIESDAASWTALASPGPSATPVLREELRFDGEVLEFGRPANDLLVTADAETARAEVLRRLGLPGDTRLVLYAPTRRPMDLRKRGWSDPGRLLDLPRVVASLPPGYELLARRHPGLADDVMGLAPGVLDVSGYPSVSELLLATDVLITDYSALLADFAITGRPVVLFVPDQADFAASPGLNVDLAQAAPGPVLRTSEDVAAAMHDLSSLAADHAGAAAAFAETHRTGGDGQAAARLVDWLMTAGGREIAMSGRSGLRDAR